MLESDLQPGDLIFFINNYKLADGSIDYSYVDHVALYAGLNDQRLPTLIHSISLDQTNASPDMIYNPEKQSGLCYTTLRQLNNQIQREDDGQKITFDVRYHVVRYIKNPVYAIKALDILKNQAKYRIPYDEVRLQQKLDNEIKLDDKGFQALGEANYRTSGIYRSIKYAARYPLPLVRTRPDGIGRGLTCSMAAILAYQIAELREKGLVDSILFYSGYWISDKHGVERSFNPTLPKSSKKSPLPKEFDKYIKGIQNDATPHEPNSLYSYHFWRGKETTPETFEHETLPIDSKTIGVAGLYSYLNAHPEAWLNLGVLDVPIRHFSSEEKKSEKEKRKENFFETLEHWFSASSERQNVVSPRHSLTPPSAFLRGQTDSPWFESERRSKSDDKIILHRERIEPIDDINQPALA